MSSDNTFVCPSCRQLDRVQKVSSIVSSGTASISTTSASGTSIGASTIELAHKLTMPNKPSGSSSNNVVGCLYVLILSTIGWGISQIFNGQVIQGLAVTLGCLLVGKFVSVFSDSTDKDRALWLEEAMREYNKRLATWNEMFYCYRCDGVFTRSSRFAPIANVAEFLSKG